MQLQPIRNRFPGQPAGEPIRSLLLLASILFASAPLPAANIVLWDTGTRLGEKLESLDRSPWKAVPSDLLSLEADPPKASSDPGYYGREYTFKGDAVVENASLVAVFWAAGGRVAIFSKEPPSAPGPAKGDANPALGRRLVDCLPLGTGPARMPLSDLEVVRNAGDEVAIAVSFGDAGASDAATTFVFGKSEIVEIRNATSSTGIRLAASIDYGIVPGFIGDDLIFPAAGAAEKESLCLPSEGLFIGLLSGGDRELMISWPRGGPGVRLQLGEVQPGRQGIASVDFQTSGQSIYLAAVGAPGLWHREPLLPAHLEADVPLAWKRPFPARWKTQLYEGDLKTGFAFRQARGQIWRGVPGSYNYPAWFDGEAAFLHPSKKVPPREECLIYFLEGEGTPAGVLTPFDFLKSTLGRQAGGELIDLGGRKLRTHHRRGGDGVRRACTCGCTEAIQAVFEAGQEMERTDFIRGALDDMIYFVARHVERINEYQAFAAEMTRFLKDSGKSAPELREYLDGLAEIAGQIPQECTVQKENMKSPSHADDLARQTLALAGKKDAGNVKAYMELLKAWRAMGGAQDYVVAQCHVITRRLAQEAALRGVNDPKAAKLAGDIRARCRNILRNPDGYEIWAEY